MIQEIKQKVGEAAEQIIADGLNLQRVGTKYRCPNVYAHKNADRNPSMGWHKEALHFHCFTCGHKIDIYSYYREHLNYSHEEVTTQLLGDHQRMPIQQNRDKFVVEASKVGPLTDECRKYINTRGIADNTIDHFKLQTYKGCIAFPYYRYEVVVGYKLRKPIKNPGKPKMASIPGSKPYLYNVQNIDLQGELVVCEGEFDAMVLHQAGYSNVVSVGAGASSLTAMLKQSSEFFENFSNIIVVSDNDDAGSEMDKQMVEALGDKVKLIDKKLYRRDGSDVNEELVINGIGKVVEIVESARWKIEGRRDLDKQPYKGIESLSGRYVATGLGTLDYGLNDLAPGFTTLVTGRANGGKTTFVRQIIANAIDTGHKVYLMNGENDPEMLLNELYQSVCGRDKTLFNSVRINKRTRKEPKPEVLKRLQLWHKGKLVMFNKGESPLKTLKDLMGMIEMEVKFGGHDLVVIDNLMSILSVQAAEKNEQQADFMQQLCNLAKAYRTHIILVLHPNKTFRKDMEFDFEHISGTSDLYNKADNIIVVIREYDEEVIAGGVNGKICVLKNRYYKDLPKVPVYYDEETGLLLEVNESTGDAELYHFQWDGKERVEGFREVKNVRSDHDN